MCSCVCVLLAVRFVCVCVLLAVRFLCLCAAVHARVLHACSCMPVRSLCVPVCPLALGVRARSAVALTLTLGRRTELGQVDGWQMDGVTPGCGALGYPNRGTPGSS